MKSALGTKFGKSWYSTSKSLQHNKPSTSTIYNMEEARFALFSKPNDMVFVPQKDNAPTEIELQLNKELRNDQKVLDPLKRIKRDPKFTSNNSSEQKIVENLYQWELDKINRLGDQIDYGPNLTNVIKEYILDNCDELLKKSWVKVNEVIRIPIQLIYNMARQAKGHSGYKEISSDDNLPVIKSFYLHLLASKMKNSTNKLVQNIKSNRETIRERGEPSSIAIVDKALDDYFKENKKLILNNEINMELLSLSLKRIIDHKKNKEDDLRIDNAELTREVQRLESVFI